MNLNKVFILGRLTATPELRTTPGGQSVTSFGVATNRIWFDKNKNKQEDVEFHNVVVWGRQAEVATQFLTKGSLVLIEGRLQTRSYKDKQGEEKRKVEIICERMQLGPRPLGTGGDRQAPGSADDKTEEKAKAEEMPVIDIEEEVKPEDLPF